MRLVNGRPIRKRAGKIVQLKAVSRAYASAVKEAGKQYNGHNGTTAIVMFAKLRDIGPLLHEDTKHDNFVNSAEVTLPAFIGDSND